MLITYTLYKYCVLDWHFSISIKDKTLVFFNTITHESCDMIIILNFVRQILGIYLIGNIFP